jgi:hypothetical protein
MMRKIDTSRWREFKLSDIFTMRNTHSIVQQDIKPDNGEIPYVTAQAGNNGVLTYISCPEEWIDDGNCIMIGGKTLSFSYQEKPFCSNDSHNIALYLKDGKKASLYCYLYLISALRVSLYSRYSWGDSISMKRIKDETFLIPVDSSGEPDWDYMDSYMLGIFKSSSARFDILKNTNCTKHVTDVIDWEKLKIKDLFLVERPNSRVQTQYSDGDIPFIASGSINNGVQGYCQKKEHELLDKGNCITVSPVDGYAFYQNQDFLGRGGAGSSIIKLYLKDNRHLLTANVALFVCTVIRMVCGKYSFTDMGSLEKIQEEMIPLPVNSKKEPDWKYMGKYMQGKTSEALHDIDILSLTA